MNKLIDDNFTEFQRYLEVARYYKKQGNKLEAVNNYAESLAKLGMYLLMMSNVSDGGYDINKDKPSVILLNLELWIDVLAETAYQFEDDLYVAYVQQKCCLLYEAMGKYKQHFDARQIKKYNEYNQLFSLFQVFVNERQDNLLSLSKLKTDKTPNEALARLRCGLLYFTKSGRSPVILEKESGGCFIATAAYMTAEHPDLDTFRDFRDRKLLNHPFGRFLVFTYYQVSPNIASYIEKKPKLRQFIQKQLTLIAEWLRRK